MVDAPGDLTLSAPGAQPPVVVEADANGNVPQRGDAVALVGESGRGVHVSLPSAAGEAVGTLARTPTEYDENATYAAGDIVGDSSLLLRHYVDWFKPADAYTASVSDTVVTDASGAVRAYDSAGGDTADLITGRVWRTTRFADYTAGKVAVVRHR